MKAMLHEIGHLFGLADTYVGARRGPAGMDTGGRNNTRGSQPTSFMSGFFPALTEKDIKNIDRDALVPLQGLVTLGKDDENGIIWLYKYTYEGLPLTDCFFPDYELEEIPFGCKPKHPLIFELKQNNNERLALDVLTDDKNLNVNAQDADGMTALHHAVLNQFEDVVTELLARSDIKPFLKNKEGLTPLQLAEKLELPRIVWLIAAHPLALSVTAKDKLSTVWGSIKQSY